ncbi:MAG TPA: hypothetical protein DCE61_04775, partial [Cellvibrionales bacterium]|nr:hypothetical protein [Cellvibrionales bacterium]
PQAILPESSIETTILGGTLVDTNNGISFKFNCAAFAENIDVIQQINITLIWIRRFKKNILRYFITFTAVRNMAD